MKSESSTAELTRLTKDWVVNYVDHMGSDLSVVNSARVSFGKRVERLSNRDIDLIRYLGKHNHWTPFAHTSITLRFTAPVFVARQFVKHQIGFVWNEVSRRYVDDSPNIWRPEEWRARPDGSVKQGSGGVLPENAQKECDYLSERAFTTCLWAYHKLLQQGVAPEQARIVLPIAHMTQWIWTGSLMAWARFYKLRADPHAQQECHIYANHVAEIMETLFPYSWDAIAEQPWMTS